MERLAARNNFISHIANIVPNIHHSCNSTLVTFEISRSKSVAPVGNIKGALSRRINIQHRLVYQVLQEEHVVKVLRMWTHYE
ncbi:MAG: type II toxin-antitoxin system YoeB family toxin [Kiritimatiellae bacterium]|nr:type II toxin-antitoxin system YoeB family toxin [Kiritimatiellia bacterium]